MTKGVARVGVVHQVLPSLHVADASGAHTLRAREALRDAGFESEVFVEHVDPALSREAHPFEDLDAFVRKGRTLLLYQLAVGSRLVPLLMRRPEPLFVNYHNLTPADFFWKWAPDWLEGVETGRQQLHTLAPRVSHAIAVSRFNERDLRSAGYRSTSVVPPFVDVGRTNGARKGEPPHPGARWLFVGKLLPHKAAHDLVKAFALYKRVYDTAATLALVGGHPVPTYRTAVEGFATTLGVGDSVSLPGAVSDAELAKWYSAAAVFVCLSDHEGFCFPLLEAMQRGVPIVAFDAGAVGDTLGDAGVLIRDKAPSKVAATVHRVLSDEPLRHALADAGRARLECFGTPSIQRQFVDVVMKAIDRL